MRRGSTLAGLVLAAAAVAAACDEGREVRGSRAAAGVDELAPVRTSELMPGPALVRQRVANPYAGNTAALREGEQLYEWMNCHGCHGKLGGGGIGPPFADAEWIYGSDSDQLFQSIAQGRPNGMPAFGGMLPADRIWMIVAYVQSIGGGMGGEEAEHPTASGSEGAPQEAGRAGSEVP